MNKLTKNERELYYKELMYRLTVVQTKAFSKILDKHTKISKEIRREMLDMNPALYVITSYKSFEDWIDSDEEIDILEVGTTIQGLTPKEYADRELKKVQDVIGDQKIRIDTK